MYFMVAGYQGYISLSNKGSIKKIFPMSLAHLSRRLIGELIVYKGIQWPIFSVSLGIFGFLFYRNVY